MDADTLRQTANSLARAAGVITEEALQVDTDLKALGDELSVLKRAADICRRMARRKEAQRAMDDPRQPFCLACALRADVPGNGWTCSAKMDTKEAVAKRRCSGYKPLITTEAGGAS